MPKFCLLFFSMIIFYGCNINSTSSNNESDKREAEQIINKFYHYLEMNEFSKAKSLFSNKFFEVTNEEKLEKIFTKTVEDCGNLTNFSLEDWKTFVVKGTDSKSEYLFLYKVTREKKQTTEKIGLIKEGDDIKIVSYNVNFDLLDE